MVRVIWINITRDVNIIIVCNTNKIVFKQTFFKKKFRQKTRGRFAPTLFAPSSLAVRQKPDPYRGKIRFMVRMEKLETNARVQNVFGEIIKSERARSKYVGRDNKK